MGLKILFFPLFSASLIWHFASSTAQEKRMSQSDINTNFMKMNEKYDFLSKTVDKLGENHWTENCTSYLDGIKTDMKQLMSIIEEIPTIKQLLLEMIETKNNEKTNFSEPTSDVVSKMTSQCTSLCESKVKNLVNETDDQLDFCLKNKINIKKDEKTFNACDPNPCLNGGLCVLSLTRTDYQCSNCSRIWSGKNCENFNCTTANKCFKREDTLYVVSEHKEFVAWDEANRKCGSEGMTLAMLKDQASSEFVVKELRGIYGSGSSTPWFWIGLSSEVSDGKLRWVDGSALGEYTGGWGFKSYPDPACVIVYLHGGSNMWDDMLCSKPYSTDFQYYSLCERRNFH